MEIQHLSDFDLIEHFKDAICDGNYNPTDTDYNKSGFTLSELQLEIMKRMACEQSEKRF